MIVKESSNTTAAYFRLPAEDLARFDAVAAARRTSRAALIRELILQTINAQQNEQNSMEVKV